MSDILGDRYIRAAVVYDERLGFICTGKRDEDTEDNMTEIIKWKNDSFTTTKAYYTVVSCCKITKPQFGYVNVGYGMIFAVQTRQGLYTGYLSDKCNPELGDKSSAEVRLVKEIEGSAYAVGFRGVVLKLVGKDSWSNIGKDLPLNFDIRAVDGASSGELLAVGRDGECWVYNGSAWAKEELPTNKNLTAVACSKDGEYLIGGHNGVLIEGMPGRWQVLNENDIGSHIWGCEYFKDRAFVSTTSAVYELLDGQLVPVDFSTDEAPSTYGLVSSNNYLWSYGPYNVMSFDGVSWEKII